MITKTANLITNQVGRFYILSGGHYRARLVDKYRRSAAEEYFTAFLKGLSIEGRISSAEALGA